MQHVLALALQEAELQVAAGGSTDRTASSHSDMEISTDIQQPNALVCASMTGHCREQE